MKIAQDVSPGTAINTDKSRRDGRKSQGRESRASWITPIVSSEVEGAADHGIDLLFQDAQVAKKMLKRKSPLLSVIPIRAKRAEGSAVSVGSHDVS